MRAMSILCLTLIAFACCGRRDILIDQKDGQFLRVRAGKPGVVLRRTGHVDSRPDLKELLEVHGDLDFIFTEINGVTNPRIVIESANDSYYEVIFNPEHRESLSLTANALALTVTKEEREISTLVLRVLRSGHRLEPAPFGELTNAEDVFADGKGKWPMGRITMEEFARFLEIRNRRPVVNSTELTGEWAFCASNDAIEAPSANERKELDSLGLVMGWERRKILVTVVKDRKKGNAW